MRWRRFGISLAAVLVLLPTAEAQQNCLIKGNINSKGERIYHPPGCRYYAATVIDPRSGERWFCSEAEAVAAG
jgi:hypothetical protein